MCFSQQTALSKSVLFAKMETSLCAFCVFNVLEVVWKMTAPESLLQEKLDGGGPGCLGGRSMGPQCLVTVGLRQCPPGPLL